MAQKRKYSPDLPAKSQSDQAELAPEIYISNPIEDRASTFLGLYSPDLKPKDLQKAAQIKDAMHKMVAWRRESNQQSINGGTKYVQGNDDDGEKYGGKKVERVLESLQVTGSCVVARWYGGIMLGPVRFEHIENVAREAVLKCRSAKAEESSKKARLDAEAEEKQRLVSDLPVRDASIATLRQLAAEKEQMAKGVEEDVTSGGDTGVENGNMPPVSTPTVDYTSLSLDRLKTLDKARDATLSFLLKRIDKAEAELKRRKSDQNSKTENNHAKDVT